MADELAALREENARLEKVNRLLRAAHASEAAAAWSTVDRHVVMDERDHLRAQVAALREENARAREAHLHWKAEAHRLAAERHHAALLR
jgi:hypothetical protein